MNYTYEQIDKWEYYSDFLKATIRTVKFRTNYNMKSSGDLASDLISTDQEMAAFFNGMVSAALEDTPNERRFSISFESDSLGLPIYVPFTTVKLFKKDGCWNRIEDISQAKPDFMKNDIIDVVITIADNMSSFALYLYEK